MEKIKCLRINDIFAFVFIMALIVFAFYSFDILLILFGSFVITCAINPIINKMEKYIPRVWCVVLILFLIMLAVLLVLVPLIITLINEIGNLNNSFPHFIDKIDDLLNFKIFNKSLSSYITFESLKTPALTGMRGLIENSIIAGKGIANFLTSSFAIAIIVFYFAYNEKELTDKFIEFIPKENKEKARKIFETISSKVGNYVFAQGIAMAFVGILTTIGLLLLGNPHALLLGFITCVFDIIPVIGPSIAITIGLVTAFGGGIGYVFLTFIVYMIAQWAQNQFLRPIVFGKLLNMHPLMIILGLLLGARFLGFWGVVLAPAIVSVICVLVDELYLKKINAE